MAAHKDGREKEWQLACADLGTVRRWLADHDTIDGLLVEPRSPLQIFDTYLDTGESIVRATRCASARNPANRRRLSSRFIPRAPRWRIAGK